MEVKKILRKILIAIILFIGIILINNSVSAKIWFSRETAKSWPKTYGDGNIYWDSWAAQNGTDIAANIGQLEAAVGKNGFAYAYAGLKYKGSEDIDSLTNLFCSHPSSYSAVDKSGGTHRLYGVLNIN